MNSLIPTCGIISLSIAGHQDEILKLQHARSHPSSACRSQGTRTARAPPPIIPTPLVQMAPNREPTRTARAPPPIISLSIAGHQDGASAPTHHPHSPRPYRSTDVSMFLLPFRTLQNIQKEQLELR